MFNVTNDSYNVTQTSIKTSATPIDENQKPSWIWNPKEELINTDGCIDTFKQGNTGDCYLLAGIEALSNTEEGKQIIKESIKRPFWGGVSVTLKGVNKTYYFSAQELLEAKQLSKGDDDVLAIELAFKKYREEKFAEQAEIDSISGKGISGLHKFFSTQEDRILLSGLDADNPIDGGTSGEVIKVLTGKDSEKFFNGQKEIKSLSDITDLSTSSVTISFKKNLSENLVSSHSYAVLKSDEKYTYLVNPWDNSKIIEVPTSLVLENFDYVDYTKLTDDKKTVTEIGTYKPIFG